MKYLPDEPHPDLWDELRRKAPKVTYPVSPEQAQHMSDTLRTRFSQVVHPRTGSVDSSAIRQARRDVVETQKVQGSCLLCGGSLYTEESMQRGMGLKCLKKGLALGIVVRKPDGTFSLKGRQKRI